MKPLVTSHRVLTWLCFCSADAQISDREKRNHILFAITISTLNAFFLISSIAYFVTFMRIDLEKALCSVYQIAGFAFILYATIALFYLRDKTSIIFTKLSEIYQTRKNRCEYVHCVHTFQHSFHSFYMEFAF